MTQATTGYRLQSTRQIGALPLWSIAMGPDAATGETRGHARAIIALGDTATGIVAIGGIARGGIAVGGVALGVLSCGGLSMGALALGGVALGIVAAGGLGMGMYALGGLAIGGYVVSATQQDAEALALFERYAPWLLR